MLGIEALPELVPPVVEETAIRRTGDIGRREIVGLLVVLGVSVHRVAHAVDVFAVGALLLIEIKIDRLEDGAGDFVVAVFEKVVVDICVELLAGYIGIGHVVWRADIGGRAAHHVHLLAHAKR